MAVLEAISPVEKLRSIPGQHYDASCRPTHTHRQMGVMALHRPPPSPFSKQSFHLLPYLQPCLPGEALFLPFTHISKCLGEGLVSSGLFTAAENSSSWSLKNCLCAPTIRLSHAPCLLLLSLPFPPVSLHACCLPYLTCKPSGTLGGMEFHMLNTYVNILCCP